MNKIKSLQFLRACAFLAVLAAHCDFPLLEGSMGVSIFFVLSGFCMAINYIPRADELPSTFKGCVRFGCGKIKKLYVLHLLMIAYVVFFLWGMPDSLSDLVILIIHALLLQSLFPSSAIITPYNGVSWFLSTYMFVCMAAPFIIKCVARLASPRDRGMRDIIKAALVVLAIMLVIGYISPFVSAAYFPDIPAYLAYCFPPYRMLDFTLGALLGKLFLAREASPARPSTLHSVLCAAAAAGCFILALVYYPSAPVGIKETLIFVPGSLLAVYSCAFCNARMQRLLSWPPAVWLGDISGHAYLIHKNSIMTMRYFLNMLEWKFGYTRTALETVIWFFLSLIMTLLLAQLYLVIARKVKGQLSARLTPTP